MFANEIQHDPRIDISRGLTRRHLEVVQIYLAHAVQVLPGLNFPGFVLEPNYIPQKKPVKVANLRRMS